MVYEAIIIGGGPAGLSAALNFGRGMRHTLVIDDHNPRNQVTDESHGYLTQDSISPSLFRQRAANDVKKYDAVEQIHDRVIDIMKQDQLFYVTTQNSSYTAQQVLIATGLRESLPTIDNIENFYGKSVFYCPWCDGYEMRNKTLAIINPTQAIMHLAKIVTNFAKEIILFTDGTDILDQADKQLLKKKQISIYYQKVLGMKGQHGEVTALQLDNGIEIPIEGAFTYVHWDTDFGFLQSLQVEREESGKLKVDSLGQTNIPGLFVAGESKENFAGQLIDAAANGGMTAKMMMMQQFEKEFTSD
ncbi:NAD(P)/FAD-dependent oxidoreductase [Gracilibacillus alcaliphilus]|uniref:NAD(P)/FAD-dependent oxidoreductase n=1 Tax=Gracilibacillus alcaliphilus TaxID=1401441 RepID=UPI001959EE71|nr:NAD(P)/FAD-dependent oxidoreductase [Gracilibacillus alcaliphilus]MBM7675768.1 thioredoxin reductase [Gracilibacillus alcaliphilus]